MADFHAADLWVAVVPETSQVGPAMEKAGKEAKGRFGEGIRGIGKHVHDEFDQIGQKAKDVFSKAGEQASTGFRGAISEIGRDIRSTIGGEFRDAFGKDFKSAADGAVKGLEGVDDFAKKIGVDLSGWLKPAQDAEGAVKDLNDKALTDVLKSVGQVSSAFETLPGKIGKAASAVTLLGGEIGLAVAALETIGPTLDKIDQKIHDSSGFGRWLEDLPKPEDMGNWLGEHLGAKQSRKFFGHLFGYDPGDGDNGSAPGGGAYTSSGGFPGGVEPYPQNFIGPIPFGAVRAPNGVAPTGPGGAPGGGSSDFYKNWYGSGASSSHSGDWDAVAGPEAGGNWHIDHGEGPDVTGGLQIATQTWLANGGGAFAPKAYMATPEQQKIIADRVLATQGPGAWPVTSRNHPQWFKGAGSGGADAMPSGGLPNVRGAHPQLAYALAAAKGMFPDLQLTAGRDDHPMDQGWHPRGQAIDIGGGTPQEQAALSNWFLQFAPDIEELIHSGPGVTQNIKSGRLTPAIDMKGSVYNSGQAGYHGDHVHLAIKDEMAQAFEDAIGGGGRTLGRPGVSGTIPTGAEHDPLYVMPASSGTGGGGAGSSPFASQGQQLGQGLVNGVLQMFGIDGSVLGGKSPLDWGAVKLGGGLLNYGMGLMNSMSGGPMGSPAMGGGGGGGLLSGLAGLIPHPGPGISAGAGPAGGSLGIAAQGASQVNHDQSFNVTINGASNTDPHNIITPLQFMSNQQQSRQKSYSGSLPEMKTS